MTVPRALITGGAGFLGSHLCDRLIVEGHEVICLDNLLTGSLDNIQHLLGHPRFVFIQHDVTRPIDLSALLANSPLPTPHSPLHFILHFASPASPKDYAQHPIHTLKVGALGTYHALGLAKAAGAVFVLASSSEVYGDPQVSPQPETYWGHVNPVGPRSVYDEAKRFAEAMAVAYQRAHGVDVRIARIFNTYGPRMRLNDGRALPTFITQALRNEPLPVYGNGLQTRSFCYVGDLIEGIYRVMQAPRDRTLGADPAASDANDPNSRPGEPSVLNLGNPDEVTILQLAHDVLRVTGSSSQIVFYPLPQDDPKVRRPEIGRAQRLLHWAPRISRAEGLRRTVAYFRRQLALA